MIKFESTISCNYISSEHWSLSLVYRVMFFIFFIKVDDLEIPELDTASDEVNI